MEDSKQDQINTSNEDINSRYFDIVQNKIKELAGKDKSLSEEQADDFNNAIFDQDDGDVMVQIKEFIDKATDNNLNLDKVAKVLYDRFKLQVSNNLFNKDSVNDVPNQLMGERKRIKTYEQFNKI